MHTTTAALSDDQQAVQCAGIGLERGVSESERQDGPMTGTALTVCFLPERPQSLHLFSGRTH